MHARLPGTVEAQNYAPEQPKHPTCNHERPHKTINWRRDYLLGRVVNLKQDKVDTPLRGCPCTLRLVMFAGSVAFWARQRQ
eukprot:2483195-Amphidinium_carterae.1